MDNVEIAGAMLGIGYLFFQYKANIRMWVFSILMSVMYVYINFINGLYANFLLQIVFIVIAIIGLLEWMGITRHGAKPVIRSLPRREVAPLLIATVLLTAVIYYALTLTGESSAPVFDSLTTAINLTGSYMLIRKYYQEWICWLIVDPLMSAMYAYMGMWPSALLYALFSVVVVFGYRSWRRQSIEKNDITEQ